MATEETKEEIATLGAARAELYAYLQENGFAITEVHHKKLKRLFNKAVEIESARFDELSHQLNKKFTFGANEVLQEMRKIDPKSFSGMFKPKHRDQLRNVIIKVQQYLLKKENE